MSESMFVSSIEEVQHLIDSFWDDPVMQEILQEIEEEEEEEEEED